MAFAEQDLPPGTRVGGYAVERTLGAGGMGTVYEAVQPVIDKRVALKVVRAEAISMPGAVERLIQEARVVNRIRHPNIVDVFGFERLADGRPVLVMELLQGETLRDLLVRRGRLDAAEAVEAMIPAIGALAAAHAAGVLHRDLKPENLFMVSAPSSTVKVLDFGIAKLLEPASNEPSFGTTGLLLGTPRYMSPEQCKGESLDVRSDLYAVGLVLYELLDGRLPFQAGSPGEFLYHHIRTPPPPLQTSASVDAELASIVMSLLAKAPSDRPANAPALLEALRSWQGRLAVAHTLAAYPSALVAATLASRDRPSKAPDPTPSSSLPSSMGTSLTGERRVCTVLMVAIDGAKELAAELGEEQAAELVERTRDRLVERVGRDGGWLVRADGELVALFGMPRSTGVDAARAVHCALKLHRAAPSVRERPRATSLRLRVALETGRIYVAPATSTGRAPVAIGNAVEQASWLCARCEPGATLLGRTISREVAGLFNTTAISLPGPDGAVAAERALEASSSPRRRDEFFGAQTKMVGRGSELERVLDAIASAFAEHRAAFMLVRGAAGVGKTRLREEVLDAIEREAQSTFVLRGTSGGLDRGTPYALLAAMLRSGFRVEAADDEGATLQKIRNGLAAVGASLSSEPLAGRAGQPADVDSTDDLVTVARLVRGATLDVLTTAGDSVEDSQRRCHGAIMRVFSRLLARGNVLVAADGLEHADDASLEVLEGLVEWLDDRPLFVLGAARPELAERRARFRERIERFECVDLKPLGRRAMEELVRDLLRHATGSSPELVQRLAERSEGSPLVARETLRLLAEASGTEIGSSRGFLVQDDLLDSLGLPTTVFGLVQARLDALQPEQRAELQWASVMGRTFRRSFLQKVAPSADHDALLATLRARDLVRLRTMDRAAGDPDPEFAFTEAITREVAYDGMIRGARQSLHREAAAWLGERPALAEASLGLLATHHDRAGDRREALRGYRRAGARAAALGQNLDAIRFFERAVELADAPASAPEPADAAPGFHDERVADWQERVELRLALGDTLRRVGRLDEASASYEHASEELLPEEQRSGAAIDEAAVRRAEGSIELRRGRIASVRGDYETALRHYRAALVHLGAASDPRLLAPLHAAIGFAQLRLGRLDAALAICKQGLAVCRSISPSEPDRADASSRLLLTLGAVFYSRKQFVRADRLYREAGRVVDEQRYPALAASALINIAAVHYELGELASAKDAFLHALAIAERVGDMYLTATATNNVAEVQLAMGEVDDALLRARAAVRLAKALRAADLLPDACRNLAQALARRGERQQALQHLCDAVRATTRPAGRPYLSSIVDALATIHGDSSAADQLSVRNELATLPDLVRPFAPAAAAKIQQLLPRR